MIDHFGRFLALVAVTALVASCGTGDRGSDSSRQFTPDMQSISDAIAKGAHFPAEAVELTSSPVRLRISVRDSKLATADETKRNMAAEDLVAVTEIVLAAHPEYAKLEAISVAIYHSNAEGSPPSQWHIEDVIEFRKGPSQRFSVHIT
jgi:hypothetical protein